MLLAMAVMVMTSAPDGGVDGGLSPNQWVLADKAQRGVGLRAQLVKELTRGWKDGGATVSAQGELPLSVDEAEALFDDPRAQLVYGEKTVSIVAPSMPKRHRQEHLDLMKLFLVPERIDAGVVFLRQYQAQLTATEVKTQVDPDVIAGILMWESKLGTITGDYKAFNVFTSQSFFIDEANAVALARKDEKLQYDEAKQAQRVATIRDRAQKNLVALARQCKAKGIDVLEVKGSWAGALGFPQFMPASLRWADDGDGDGAIDLYQMRDSIASIGKYLKAHGFAESRDKAVYGYNHEAAYVQGVLAFADALKVATGRADGGVTDAGW
jgi:membrane-bound lytic murein transglycosylase B